MSTKEKKMQQVSDPVEVTAAPSVVAPPVPSKLMDLDKMTLDLAKSRVQTALAEAKTAEATAQNAELGFKYVVLQIYMKYGLSNQDAIAEDGTIIKGGAAQTQGQ